MRYFPVTHQGSGVRDTAGDDQMDRWKDIEGWIGRKMQRVSWKGRNI
jgi:hypothetical protein